MHRKLGSFLWAYLVVAQAHVVSMNFASDVIALSSPTGMLVACNLGWESVPIISDGGCREEGAGLFLSFHRFSMPFVSDVDLRLECTDYDRDRPSTVAPLNTTVLIAKQYV